MRTKASRLVVGQGRERARAGSRNLVCAASLLQRWRRRLSRYALVAAGSVLMTTTHRPFRQRRVNSSHRSPALAVLRFVSLHYNIRLLSSILPHPRPSRACACVVRRRCKRKKFSFATPDRRAHTRLVAPASTCVRATAAAARGAFANRRNTRGGREFTSVPRSRLCCVYSNIVVVATHYSVDFNNNNNGTTYADAKNTRWYIIIYSVRTTRVLWV